MSETVNLGPFTDWTAVAVGPGPATFTPRRFGMEWIIAPTAPTLELGHIARANENVSLQLESGETLYLRGPSRVAVTPTVAP